MSGNVERPRILVVEDEFLIRLTLVEALGDEGYSVLEAESGDAALPMLRDNGAIRLLLTDIQLPGSLDGRALAMRLRQDIPDLPVIFMTGRLDQTFEVSSPLDVFITKPYTLSDVCIMAKRLVPSPA